MFRFTSQLQGAPAARMRLQRWLLATLAFALSCSLGASTAFAAKKVLLDFEPDNDDLADLTNWGATWTGPITTFETSALVARLDAANPDMTAAQIAAKLKDAIKGKVENIYQGKNITFTTDPNAKGIDKTVFMVSGRRVAGPASHAGSLGLAFLNGARGWVFVDEFEQSDLWTGDNTARKMTQDEAAQALGKTAAHELGHLLGLDDNNPADRADNPGGTQPAGSHPPLKTTTGTMAQGASVAKMNPKFLKADNDKIAKDLAKPEPQKDVATVGAKNRFGSIPQTEDPAEDTATPRTIGPTGIGQFTGPGPGQTNQQLLNQPLNWPLTLPLTFEAEKLNGAFLTIRFWNIHGDDFQIVNLEGIDLLASPSSEFRDIDQIGGQFSVVHVNLLDHATLPQLKALLADNTATLALQAVPSYGMYAIDYIQLTAYSDVPQPIPAVSDAGMLVMIVVMVVAMSIAMRRRRSTVTNG